MSANQGEQRVRRRVIYAGRVQGVFFRATSSDLAQGYEVVGFVRNLPDGTVELEAEGPAEQVDRFLGAVEQHFSGNIQDKQVEEQPPTGSEGEFAVRH